MKILVFLAGALLLSAAAGAEDVVDVNEGFPAQREQIEVALQDGETYSELGERDRQQVLAALDRMESIIASAPSIDALPPPLRVELFNQQDLINTMLLGAREDSRVVCERRAITGSRRYESFCETVAERRARSERELNARSVSSPRVQQERDGMGLSSGESPQRFDRAGRGN